jgi:hypothetical protein
MQCPKCKSEIDSLNNVQSGTMAYDLSILDDGEIHYESGDFEADDNVNEFWCPLCNAVLFNNEEQAVSFLKNKKEVEA